MRRGVADVATSRKRVELQVNQLEAQSAKLQDQAQKAITMGREDLAREALTRKSGVTGQITDLKAQHAQLQGEEEKLTLAQQRLQAKVESFRTRKETIKATYTAAEAQTRINEAMSGIGEEMGDVGLAIQRAEDKTAQMQARAGAIDELIASGALDDVSSGQRRRRHRPRARRDELAVRRRGRAGPAQGRRPARRRSRPRRRRDILRAEQQRNTTEGAVMIVRILGEGQYDVADDAAGPAQRARRRGRGRRRGGDTGRVRGRARRAARRRPRRRAAAHDAEALDESDLILPPADASIDEVRELLDDDGLIPG